MTSDCITALRRRLDLPVRSKEEWVTLLRTYNPDALNHIYRLVYDRCAWVLRRRSFSEPDFQDAAQDVMIAIMRILDADVDYIEKEFELYIVGIARNKCLDMIRKRSLISEDELKVEHEVDVNQKVDGVIVYEETLDDLLWNIMTTSFSKFSEENQKIAMWYIDEIGPKDIRTRLHNKLSEGSISKRWYSMRRKINEFLDTCSRRLPAEKYLLLYLYIDRSRRGFRKNTSDSEIETGFKSRGVRLYSINQILSQIRSMKEAISKGKDPYLPNHGDMLVQIEWSALHLPETLTIEYIREELKNVLVTLAQCIAARAKVREGASS